MDEGLLGEVLEYLRSHTGLRSPASNNGLLKRVFARQAREAGLDAPAFFSQVRMNDAVRTRFLNSVLIGETYFFREFAQFRVLRDNLLPELFAQSGTVRCWSVSCSTGEEAVSLALVLDSYRKKHGGAAFRVYASDINTESLSVLERGRFPRSSLRRDGAEFHELLLDNCVAGEDRTHICISPEILSTIDVHRLNFFRDSLDAIPNGLDLIFFRNTLLYSDEEERHAIVNRVVAKLRPGGFVFFAGAEVPFVQHEELKIQSTERVHYLVKAPPPEAVPEQQCAPALVLERPKTAAAEPYTDALRLVKEILSHANSGSLEDAEAATRRLQSMPDYAALAAYCAGWLRYMAKEPSAAIPLFDRAVALDPQFWPARYYRAVSMLNEGLHEKNLRSIGRELNRCIESIRLQGSAPNELYTLVLDGFSAAYFERMCETRLQKLSEEGSWP